MEGMIKEYFKKALTLRQKRILRNFVSRFSFGDLDKLAIIHATDKWNSHWYTQHYRRHFQHLRKKRLKILEIGVGGEEDPELGGASLRMWKGYFPHSTIYSIDIYDKSLLQENRIRIFKGNQIDQDFLKNVCHQIGSPDIIIDDGSHINEHVITTFKILFPLLNEDGIYAVEDVQTSYWPSYGGDSENLNNPATTMNFFKQLTDSVNSREFMKPNYDPTYFDRNIISIHFYHNLIFIHKGVNSESSNKGLFAGTDECFVERDL